jgi:hypothetical protein
MIGVDMRRLVAYLGEVVLIMNELQELKGHWNSI